MFDYFTINNVIQFVKMVLNVAVVWVAFYFILKIVKNNSRTIQIFKGILLIFIIKGVAELSCRSVRSIRSDSDYHYLSAGIQSAVGENRKDEYLFPYLYLDLK